MLSGLPPARPTAAAADSATRAPPAETAREIASVLAWHSPSASAISSRLQGEGNPTVSLVDLLAARRALGELRVQLARGNDDNNPNAQTTAVVEAAGAIPRVPREQRVEMARELVSLVQAAIAQQSLGRTLEETAYDAFLGKLLRVPG